MKQKRRLASEEAHTNIIETLIAVGISVTMLTVFLFSASNLYKVQENPEVDLTAKSLGIAEMLIYSTGQDSSQSPDWQTSPSINIKSLGLGTTMTTQYGVADFYQSGSYKIIDGPYPKSSVGDTATCFLAGTKIVMADGSYKNIEDIKSGDIVKAYDEKNHRTVNSKVTQTFHHTPKEMGEYYLIINNQLRVTPNHRFYLDSKWVYANELKIGDNLFSSSSNYKVYSIEKIFEQTYTYNFEVENQHNYFVAMENEETLVHNGTPLNAEILEPEEGALKPQGIEITFIGRATGGTSPDRKYDFAWTFDALEVPVWVNDIESPYAVTYTYELTGIHPVTLYVRDANDVVDQDQVNIEIVIPPGQDYFLPIVNFDWFDSNGPFGDNGGKICFDATESKHYGGGGLVTLEIHGYDPVDDEWQLLCSENDLFIEYDFQDANPEPTHTIYLRLEDEYGFSSISEQEIVQIDAEPENQYDSEPWILAGKDLHPDDSDNSFTSQSKDYYVLYRDENNEYVPVSPQELMFEVKKKTTTGSPILDIEKIQSLSSSDYESIKTILGLDSDQRVYNYFIKITDDDELTPLDFSFGANYDNTLATESTTTKVLIYKPPTVELDITDPLNPHLKIKDHIRYTHGQITVYVFIGGTPP